MLKRLGIADFLGLLIHHIEAQTGKRCYEAPEDQKSPFYALELVETVPKNTKTQFIDRYQVTLHAIAAPSKGPFSFQPVAELEQELEEAMTVPLEVPEPFYLVNQDFVGLNGLKKDPSGEGHAIITVYFDISYGFICK